MLRRLFITILFSLALIACTDQVEEQQQQPEQQPVDLLIHNANIYTLDWPDPDADRDH